MLQLKTIDKETFALLKAISSHKELHDFSLAGGTGLALQLGHRISIDLDFFTRKTFDTTTVFEFLRKTFSVSNCIQTTNSISLYVKSHKKEIKVDIIRHNYPLLCPIQKVDHIQIFSLEDIAAMKLNAIANRGSKKDFYDIHTLLTRYSIKELLSFFEKKYQQINSYTVVKSLVYFGDADLEPEPISLTETTWDEIKANLRNIVPTL